MTDHTDHTEDLDAHCADCRAGHALLGSIPPEAFLDGPPRDADLLLPRTLRRIENEKAAARRRRTLTIGAAAAVVALAALGGGVVLGRASDTQPGVSVAQPANVPGTRQLTGSDSGAKLAATVVPANGWVWVHASVSGIPAGQKCRLVVVSRTGQAEIAGSWLVPDKPAGATTLVGTALVAPAEVAAVEVQNLAGHVFVRAST